MIDSASNLTTDNLLSVSQLTNSIKGLLENNFTHTCVKGEISNLTKHSSGHWYFSLKDQNAQIQCAMFRNANKSVHFPINNGDQVIVIGSVSVYPPRGNYQLLCKTMQPQGIGALLLQLEELKKQLKERGFFDSARKKPLPSSPQVIGIITSPTGAAVQDIIHVLKRRFNGKKIILNPVKVQGPGSAEEIAKAIDQMNQHLLADVLIVGRGGGSIEDLWAFNEISVAEAIYRSKIPIVSAVGHETDFTIADLVADVRAPTPSAAAEVITESRLELFKRHQQTIQQIDRAITHRLRIYRRDFSYIFKSSLLEKPSRLLQVYFQQLDQFDIDLQSKIQTFIKHQTQILTHYKKMVEVHRPLDKIARQKQSVKNYSFQLNQSILTKVKRERNIITQCNQAFDQQIQNQIYRFTCFYRSSEQTIVSTHPNQLLMRGFSIISDGRGNLIQSIGDVREDERIHLKLKDGQVDLTPKDIKTHPTEVL